MYYVLVLNESCQFNGSSFCLHTVFHCVHEGRRFYTKPTFNNVTFKNTAFEKKRVHVFFHIFNVIIQLGFYTPPPPADKIWLAKKQKNFFWGDFNFFYQFLIT